MNYDTGGDVGHVPSCPMYETTRVVTWSMAVLAAVSAFAGAAEPLLRNGSFEQNVSGVQPPIPAYWNQTREHVLDRMEMITDATVAHQGRRCLKLSGHSAKGINLHAIGSPLNWASREDYTIQVWARTELGAQATLRIRPGQGEVQLTDRWTRYGFDHRHDTDADKPPGLAIRVVGGPAYVDDITVFVEGKELQVPLELIADYSKLRHLSADTSWRKTPDEPVWSQRIVVRVSELAGEPARSYPVELPLRGILPGFRFDDISAARLRVVDASQPPDHAVPFALVKTKTRHVRAEGRTGWDRLVLLADCPMSATKTYYVYVAQRLPDGRHVSWPTTLPAQWPKSSYKHQLEILYHKEPRVEIGGHVRDGDITLRLRNATARDATVHLESPHGDQRLPIELVADPDNPGTWFSAPGARMPPDAPTGVWRIVGSFTDETGQRETESNSLLYGSAIWAAHHTERIFSNDRARYGAWSYRLSAARNEKEVFQVVVSSTRRLDGVRLSGTQLVHKNGRDTIPRSQFQQDRIEEIYLSCPIVTPTDLIPGFGAFAHDGRGGMHPDPLFPWRAHSVSPGKQRVGWVSIKVPQNARAGQYRGSIVASSADGTQLQLPVTLTVYDFSLPDVRRFTPVLGGDGGGNLERTLSIAKLLGSRGVTPFYYNSSRSPYPAPWTYDPRQGTATFDFATFDRNARSLLEEAGVKYLFLASEYHPGGKRIRAIFDSGSDSQVRHHAANGTPEADAMWSAWARGMSTHLEQMGWRQNAYVYLADEPEEHLLPVMDRIARILEQQNPLHTFVAAAGCYGSGQGTWHEYLNRTDAFSGDMSEVNRVALQARGGNYWGLYNRPWFVGVPRATQRLIGLDSWLEGISHYFHWAMTNLGNNRWRVEPRRLAYFDRIGDYPAGTFLRYAQTVGAGNAVYFWPDDEPVPTGQTRPVASSVRLDGLSEGIDDFEYMEILKSAAQAAPPDSPVRTRYEQLTKRLEELIHRARIGGSYTHVKDAWSYFELEPELLEQFRDEVARAIEASRE